MSDVDLPSAERVRRELARLLELDLRDSELTRTELERRCREASAAECFAVCVNGASIPRAVAALEETTVKVVAAVAFPSGSSDADVKRYETEVAVDSGAQMIEVVANVGRILDRDASYLVREWRDLLEAAEGCPVGLALPARVLQLPDLEWLVPLIVESGVRGVTLEFGEWGDGCVATVLNASATLGPEIGLKAGIRGLKSLHVGALLKAGAVRFGTADLNSFLTLP